MNPPQPTVDLPEPNLDEVVAEFLRSGEAGRAPDRTALLARYPALADELREFFADFDQFEQFAFPLRAARPGDSGLAVTLDEAGDASTQTAPFQSRGAGVQAPSGEIAGYEILGVLGRGGMGIVYKARHTKLRRVVALKMMLSGGHASEAEQARFRIEAEAVAQLQHPNIVQVFEVGEHQNQPFCSLEFVAGGNLAEKLGGKPQSPHEAALMARTLATAMATAHRQNIIHRDLKPANVLLSEEGVPKITDFGLAKKLDEDQGQTRTGAVMGTPAYMAPEQALGNKEIGPLADVYSLGAILYEMLTGRPPFRGETVLETLDQVRTLEPVAVRLLEPKVPRDLETICLKCLEKDPRKRYAGAQELAEDLGRFLNGEPIRARRSGPVEHAYRWVRRNPVVATLGTLLMLAFVIGFVVVAWQLRQTQAALDEAKANLYFQRVNLADREAQAGNTDRADVLLDLCPPKLRHWEWHYLKQRCRSNWMRLEGHTDLIRCVAYSPDGNRVASCGNDGTVRIWDPTNGRELRTLVGHAGWVSAVLFHQDGKRLLSAATDGTVKVWDVWSGQQLNSYPCGYARDFQFTADGRYYCTVEMGQGLSIYELETQRLVRRITGKIAKHIGYALSQDGKQAALVLDDCLRVWDVATGRSLRLLSSSLTTGAVAMAFSPSGDRLFVSYCSSSQPVVGIWDLRTEQTAMQKLSTPLSNFVIAVGPDGRLFATGSSEGAVKVRDLAGKDLFATRTFKDTISSLAFRPDGQGVAVGTGADIWLRSWEKKKDHGITTLRGPSGEASAVAFSPDGSLLAAVGETDQIQLWDARTGQLHSQRKAGAGGFSTVGFSRDGGTLLATGRNGQVYSWVGDSEDPGLSLSIAGTEMIDALFSPDGQRIATASSDRLVRLWDAASGQETLTCTGNEAGVLSVQYSQDGLWVAASGSDGTVRIWNAATGREHLVLRGHAWHVQSIAFSPRGDLLASGSTDETICLWNTVSGQQLFKLQGHTGPVRRLSFSPDGKRLASVSEDGTLRLWDVGTGQEALALPEMGKVNGVSFSPDGLRLATCSSEGTVKIYHSRQEAP